MHPLLHDYGDFLFFFLSLYLPLPSHLFAMRNICVQPLAPKCNKHTRLLVHASTENEATKMKKTKFVRVQKLENSFVNQPCTKYSTRVCYHLHNMRQIILIYQSETRKIRARSNIDQITNGFSKSTICFLCNSVRNLLTRKPILDRHF